MAEVKPLQVLDLFSGVGGFSLGLERAGMETVAFCEIDPFCRKVLKKHWPHTPIHSDIRSFDARQYRGKIDVLCGGFPCQPFSTAGKQKGKEDDRYLFPDMLRIVAESDPAWFIGENVGGFVSMVQFDSSPPVDEQGNGVGALGDLYTRLGRGVADEAVEALEALGYTVQAFVIPACGVDAYHRRDRCWIVAHHNRLALRVQQVDLLRELCEIIATQYGQEIIPVATGQRCGEKGRSGSGSSERIAGGSSTMADSIRDRSAPWVPEEITWREGKAGVINDSSSLLHSGCELHEGWPAVTPDKLPGPWEFESRLGRALNGLSRWLDGFNYVGDPDASGVPRVTVRKDLRPDRLKGMGNAVVPQIPEIFGRAIVAITRELSL